MAQILLCATSMRGDRTSPCQPWFAATAIDNVDDIFVDRGPSWRSPFATPALDSGPLGGAGRLVGAGWRGMPGRAICCEPDSGKGSRQAIGDAVSW